MKVEYRNGNNNTMYFLIGDDLQIVSSNKWELVQEKNELAYFMLDGEKYRYEGRVFQTREAAEKRKLEFELALQDKFVCTCKHCGAVLSVDPSQDKLIYDGAQWVIKCPVCAYLTPGSGFLQVKMDWKDGTPQWLKELKE